LATRIQICGRVVATMCDRRVEEQLPGRQGRLLFVFLVLNRLRPCSRDQLVAALWEDTPPAAPESALNALLSKHRRAVGAERFEGRSELRLLLPDDAFVDLEAAKEGLHRAESAIVRGDWSEAWGPARVALHTAARGFLPGENATWVEEQRRALEEIELRALECVARAGVGLGGGELAATERSARSLISRAPYRESGYRLLMNALALRDNKAEALQVYEGLRRRLREELGATPSEATKALHRELLG
jgi:SARP family transcriptional regulator, regulator of embCAB operon